MIAARHVRAPDTTEPTPIRVFLEDAARERIEHVARLRERLGRPPLGLSAAFSVKTNPRAELLQLARENGFLAEVISDDELRWAEQQGYPPDRIVYNGPLPVLERSAPERLGWIFADSVEAFARNVRRRIGHVLGVRLRPSMLASRFGVPIEDDRALGDAFAAAPSSTQLGVSFHARREDFHGAGWRDVAGDVLERAIALQARTGRAIVAFDMGGGWTPEEFDRDFAADTRWLVERIVVELPACTHLIFEPGQAVCTPTEALVTRVLEVRERGARREAIVDAGYPDWPQMHAYVHGFFVGRNGGWAPIGHGPDRIGGRTCLEYDLVDGLRLPADLAAGDAVLITGTGSYDHSMAFGFARGGP